MRFSSPADRLAVAERVTHLACDRCLVLTPPPLCHTPAQYLRADGTSRLRPTHHVLYTWRAVIDAEARLLEAGREGGGPALPPATVAAVAAADLPGRDHRLGVDQALAVEQVATSGRILDVLVGPAGSGKSAAMAGLRAAWEAEHGPGSVVGLAPSAAAAEVLAGELGTATENTAKWLVEQRRMPELEATRERLPPAWRAIRTPPHRTRSSCGRGSRRSTKRSTGARCGRGCSSSSTRRAWRGRSPSTRS